MKWTKPSAETIAYFERIAPGPPIETRTMMGMPSRFLNGHMLVAVFQDTLMLHLKPEDRAACIEAGAKPFAPMGREAKEYVDIAPGTFDDREMKEWIVRGMRYLGSLPPKLTGGAKTLQSPTVPASSPRPVQVKVVRVKPAKKAQAKPKARPAKPTRSKKPARPLKKAVKATKRTAKLAKVVQVARKPARAVKRAAKAGRGKKRK